VTIQRQLGTSISAVIVADDAVPSIELARRLGDVLADWFSTTQIVIVCAGPSDAASLALKHMVEALPDIAVCFLAVKCEPDLARLVGLDHALGDWVLCLTPTEEEIEALPRLLEHHGTGHDVIIAEAEAPERRMPTLYGVLERLYFKALDRLVRSRTRPGAFSVRLYSRVAALHIANSAIGEVLIRSSTLAGGFLTLRLPDCYRDPRAARRRSLLPAIGRGLRLLVTSTAAPLRWVTLVAVASGVLSIVYSLYVLGIYLLKPDVEPGWTTISLQISGVMFLFSVIFTIVSEYLVQIHANSLPRRRHIVVRELRSSRTRRAGRLNVVDHLGRFHLGGPLADADRNEPAA
jgi:hypothetical protein